MVCFAIGAGKSAGRRFPGRSCTSDVRHPRGFATCLARGAGAQAMDSTDRLIPASLYIAQVEGQRPHALYPTAGDQRETDLVRGLVKTPRCEGTPWRGRWPRVENVQI